MRQKKNITISGYNHCTGCGGCSAICPSKCISMKLNKLGFYAPYVDESKCTECGICIEVCYKFLHDDSIDPRAVFEKKRVIAVVNNYHDQLRSVNTAGVASRLSSDFIKKGHVVYGVVFDPIQDVCKHIAAKDLNDIERFKTSKYLQSDFMAAFAAIDGNDKTIIFGTPCQIYGVRKYIEKKKIEKQFVLVDLFCRGVPSLALWKAYKSFIQRNFKLADFEQINFRDKSSGWHRFSIKIVDKFGKEYLQSVYNDLFFSFYLRNVCLNRSCYACKLRHDTASADIRLGDFWGEKYRRYDDGVGLVVLLTEAGENAWHQVESFFRFEECETSDIFAAQKINKIPIPDHYDEILHALASGNKLEDIHVAFGINLKRF